MKVVIATTTGFHLRRLASYLDKHNVDMHYFSYMPRYRLQREGLNPKTSSSLFWPLMPTTALALNRHAGSLQKSSVEQMLRRTDDYIAHHLPPCDIFIGLSGMAVKSAQKAKQQYGATVLIERGSRHVLSQNRLLQEGGGTSLSKLYVNREIESYEAADFVTVLSEHAKQSFIEEGFEADRLFVNPLGVDLDTFTPSPRPSGNVSLLFVGGWSIQKGADLLGRLMLERPHWHLTHVGTMGDAEFPKLPNLKSVGHLDHKALSKVMARHHTLVLPSRQDGFGMVLLEGLASGLSVVASDMTGGPDIKQMISTKSSVEIHSANNYGSLLAALDHVVARESVCPNERHRLTNNDRAKFSWEAYGSRYLQFIRNLRN